MTRGTRLYLIGSVVLSALVVLFAWRNAPALQTREPVDIHRQEALATAKLLLSADSVFDRFLAAGTLLEAGDRGGYEMLVEGLISPDPMVARAAMDTMLSVPDFCALAQAISDMAGRPVLGQALLRGIAYFSRQDALPYVRGALNSSNPTTRIGALRTVARLHDDKALALVQESLKSRGMMDDERANVYYALSVLGDGVSLQDDIIDLAHSNDTIVREIAAVALGNINSDQSREALAQLVQDREVRVRVAALGSHINVGGRQSITQLEHFITSGHRDDAMIAAAALKRVPMEVAEGIIKRVTECCDLKVEVALRLMETWGRIGGGVIDLTVPAWGLRHGDPDVRLQTLWALGWRGDQSARELALPYLKDPDPALRGMAAWAVSRTSTLAHKVQALAPGEEPPACPVNYHHREEFKHFKVASAARAPHVLVRG